MQQEPPVQNSEIKESTEQVIDVVPKREIPSAPVPVMEQTDLWGAEPEEPAVTESVLLNEKSKKDVDLGSKLKDGVAQSIVGDLQPAVDFKSKLVNFGAAVGYIAGNMAALASSAGAKFVSKVGEVIEQRRTSNSVTSKNAVPSVVGEAGAIKLNKEMESQFSVDATSDSPEAKKIKKEMIRAERDFITRLGELYRSNLPQNRPGDIRNSSSYGKIKSSSLVRLAGMFVGISAFLMTAGTAGPLVAAAIGYLNYKGTISVSALTGATFMESDFMKDKISRFRGDRLRAKSILSHLSTEPITVKTAPGPKM